MNQGSERDDLHEKDEEEEWEDEDDSEEDMETWTSDGKAPYIFWHVNSHGAMNDTKKSHKHDKKETDMTVRAYSIAGNQNQSGWAAILSETIPLDDHYECRGKAIDFCIPSVERIVWSDRKAKGYDIDRAYNVTIRKVKNLYFYTNTFERIQEKGGFEVMDNPTLYHEYQLHGNEGENTRSNSRKRLPKRAAAGDIKVSDKMIYGIWVVCTNIKVLEPLALTSITDEELSRVKENKGRPSNHLFLPPELMNRLNMASRQNRMPLGAVNWMKAIDDLKKNYFTSDQELRKLRIRARTALENLWKTRKTNSHDIIDIFAPFNQTGKQLGHLPLTLYSIDGSCRSNIGELNAPDPDKQLNDENIEDSLNHYDGIRRDPLSSRIGGTKRKYSRKRRTPPRTGIRFTRRRRTRY